MLKKKTASTHVFFSVDFRPFRKSSETELFSLPEQKVEKVTTPSRNGQNVIFSLAGAPAGENIQVLGKIISNLFENSAFYVKNVIFLRVQKSRIECP